MPQTLLSVLALALASIIAFNLQRLTQQSYRNALREEVQLAASGTAQHIMEMAAARSFDEVTTPRPLFQGGNVPLGATTFTVPANFAGDRGGAGCNLLDPGTTADCDDVDDLDGLTDVPVEARLSDNRVLPYLADVRVFYVSNPSDSTASGIPTLHKRIELVLRPDAGTETRPVLTISRVISYDPVKAEADMEAACGPMGTVGSPCA
jgi:hypothetical protein